MKLDLRKLMYLTQTNQKDLAKKLEVSQVAVHNWKTGKNFPNKTTVKHIENITNEPIEKLLL